MLARIEPKKFKEVRRLAISSAEFGRRRAHAGHAAALPGHPGNRRAAQVGRDSGRVGRPRTRAAPVRPVRRRRRPVHDRRRLLHNVVGTLAGAATAVERARRRQSVEVVSDRAGPGPGTGRLTAAVVVGLIGQATKEILLVSYAAHSEPGVEQALTDAVSWGIEVTLVLERAADNPAYTFTGPVFAGLNARRLYWPSSHRPTGASLHAKVIVVDRKTGPRRQRQPTSQPAATGRASCVYFHRTWAMERNLGCGILVRGGGQPKAHPSAHRRTHRGWRPEPRVGAIGRQQAGRGRP